MSATEARQRVSDYHSFLALAWAVNKNHGPDSDEIRVVPNSVAEFLHIASSRDIRERGKELEAILSRAIKVCGTVIP